MIRSFLLASAALLLTACGGDADVTQRPGQAYTTEVWNHLYEYAERLQLDVQPILTGEDNPENTAKAVKAWAKALDVFVNGLASAEVGDTPASLVKRVKDMQRDAEALQPLVRVAGFDRKLASQASRKLGTRKRLFQNEVRSLGLDYVVVDR